jgi:peptidoglycan-associated lipoprotein
MSFSHPQKKEETMRIEGLCAVTLVLSGCAADPKPPPLAAPAPLTEPPRVHAPESPKSPTKSRVVISEEIRRACGITEADANFAFDSARLRAFDYPVLKSVAQCFTSGPLAGRAMRLVGHADPRGGAEYNLVLGGQRADNVKLFLLDKGVKSSQVATTSRGELDAKGTSEATWLEDRRVDVLLAR